MRLLIFILLLSVQSFGQTYVFPAIAGTDNHTDPPVTGVRTLIYDDFTGSSLDSKWNVRRPNKQTITVSGGEARVQVSTDTIPQMVGYSFSNLTTQCMIYDTAYKLTCIRNYTVEVKFKINKLNDTTLGVFAGCYSPFVVDYPFSNFTHVQFSSPDSLRMLAGKDTMFNYPPTGHQQITFTFNTTDNYILRHRVHEQYTEQVIKNVTTGDSLVRYQGYNFTNGAWPGSPNYFYFAFGAIGRTDVSFDYIHVTTPEELNPKWVALGDSKTVGYFATSRDSTWANMLKRNTNDSIQVWAGGGMGVDEVLLTLERLYDLTPDYVILDLGTNNSYDAGNRTKYQRIHDSLIAHGVTKVYKLMQPNGGNPVGGGGWNQWIKDTYPSDYIDDWTTGWNTWSTGNGKMYDGVHTSLTGMQERYAIIKAALISFFPL